MPLHSRLFCLNVSITVEDVVPSAMASRFGEAGKGIGSTRGQVGRVIEQGCCRGLWHLFERFAIEFPPSHRRIIGIPKLIVGTIGDLWAVQPLVLPHFGGQLLIL